MKFPSIGEIATTSVIFVDINETISNATKIMFENGHSNLIVIDSNNNIFKIFTVNNLLAIKIQSVDLNTFLSQLDLKVVKTASKDKNILQIVEYLSCETEYICTLNDDGSLHGLVTHTDITSSIDPDILMSNLCLQDFLKLGKRSKWIDKNMQTADLLREMTKNHYESVMIIEDFKPIGIFTTKDIVKIIKNNRNLQLPISSYMSSPVETIHKNSSVKEALDFLKQKHYKRVIVVDDNGKMMGAVSQKELISLSYSKWAMLIREHHEELCQINASLLHKCKRYEVMASTDNLTGLYNRNKFEELYSSSYQTMIERENSMSLIILDIDNFKKVNDIFGHNVGDDVLIKISQELQNILRNIDIVCRWGGEEFAVLLPATEPKDALYLAEKLRSHIEKLKIDKVNTITASFGVSKVYKGEELKDVLNRADKALYEAKESGRNCVKTNF